MPDFNVSDLTGGQDPNGSNSYISDGSNGYTGDPNGQQVGTVASYSPDGSSTDTSGSSGNPNGGMFNLPDIANSIGQSLGFTGGAGNSVLPALVTALDQYKNSGQYMDIAQKASSMANPFGQYRQKYGDMLSALEKDPSQIVNTPGYKFSLNQALDNTQSRLAAAGYGGSSQMGQALATEAQGLASKTYNDTIDQLSKLAGAQFSPDAAANLLSSGMTNSMLSRSMALQSLLAPFAQQYQQTQNGNHNGSPVGGPGGGSGSMPNLNKIIGNATGNDIYDPTTGTYNHSFVDNSFNWNDPSTWGNTIGDGTWNDGTGIDWSNVGGGDTSGLDLSGQTDWLSQLGLGGIGGQ